MGKCCLIDFLMKKKKDNKNTGFQVKASEPIETGKEKMDCTLVNTN